MCYLYFATCCQTKIFIACVWAEFDDLETLRHAWHANCVLCYVLRWSGNAVCQRHLTKRARALRILQHARLFWLIIVHLLQLFMLFVCACMYVCMHVWYRCINEFTYFSCIFAYLYHTCVQANDVKYLLQINQITSTIKRNSWIDL